MEFPQVQASNHESVIMLSLNCEFNFLFLILITLMSHLLTGTKFSDFTTFVFSVPWFRGSAIEVVTSVFIL